MLLRHEQGLDRVKGEVSNSRRGFNENKRADETSKILVLGGGQI
jgi:hypothetical protein